MAELLLGSALNKDQDELLKAGMRGSRAAIAVWPGSASNDHDYSLMCSVWLDRQSIPAAGLEGGGPQPPEPQVGIISYIPIKLGAPTTWKSLRGK